MSTQSCERISCYIFKFQYLLTAPLLFCRSSNYFTCYNMVITIFQSISMIESNLLPVDNSTNEMHSLTMWYRDNSRERNYRQLPNSRFRHDLISACAIFAFVTLMQLIVFKRYIETKASHPLRCSNQLYFLEFTVTLFCSFAWVQLQQYQPYSFF